MKPKLLLLKVLVYSLYGFVILIIAVQVNSFIKSMPKKNDLD